MGKLMGLMGLFGLADGLNRIIGCSRLMVRCRWVVDLVVWDM